MDSGSFNIIIEDESTKDNPQEETVTTHRLSLQKGKKGVGGSDVLAQGDGSYWKIGNSRPQKVAKARPRACRPTNPPFDTRRYVEIILHFDAFKNFETEEIPLPGQYIIRASCMGKIYGHFVSQSVDLHSIALFSRADAMHPHCPDVIIDEEFLFYIRFKDMLDNPIMLSLLDAGPAGDISFTDYERLKPIGYICLDAASILDFQHGRVEEHIEPWVIPDPKILKSFQRGQPMLQLSIECQRGMPSKVQLRQGNIMNVFVESMSHLPPEILDAASDPSSNSQMDVMITLPHSEKNPCLEFPGGKYNDGNFSEPPFTHLKSLDEATQTGDPLTNSVDLSSRYAPTKHWASIAEYWSDIPVQARAISSVLPPEVEDENTETYGDAAEAYENSVGYCQEPRIVWDAQHKRYIAVESYKKMLTRLSQDVIWPLEVAVTLKKSKREKYMNSSKSSKAVAKKTSKRKTKQGAEENETSEVSNLNSKETVESIESEQEPMLLNELGKDLNSDAVLVYHGIAFVDLNRLVYPGVQKARFACRLYPFSQQLLTSKTCMSKSAFAEALDGMTTLPAFDRKLDKAKKASRLGASSISSSETLLGEEEDPDQPERELEECFPFIVLEISLKRSIIPLYKTPEEIPEIVQDFIPSREIPRRKLINAGIAQQKFRRAVVEAAAEISAEFSTHYWKEVVLGGQEPKEKQEVPLPTSTDTLKRGFVFYLNASGRYLVIREHLRQAVCHIVQQKCLNLKPSGFETHRDFQSFLSDMYTYLMDEVHESLSRTALQEVDPLEPVPYPPKSICSPDDPISFKELEQKALLRELLFYSEESFSQGDFDTCHKLHLQRICRSREDSNCWVDFAIMWMNRGDDRMAEMAVREALRNNEKNIYALIIGGLIAIRHSDERGVDCLNAALGLKPLNPEIMVILALAHAKIGNEMGSDFFFRKAAYTHRTLAGKEVGDLDKIFDKISRSVGIKQSVRDINKAQEAVKPETSIPNSGPDEELITNTMDISPENNNSQQKRNSHQARPSELLKAQRLSNNSNSARKMSVINDKVRQSIRKSIGEPFKIKTEEVLVPDDDILLAGQEELELADDADFYTRKDSITRRSTRKNSVYEPRFDFVSDIANISMEDVLLPPLRPSIQIPWNATEFSDKLKGFLDAANKIETAGEETDIAPDEVIKAEYDKIIQEQQKGSKEVINSPLKDKSKSEEVHTINSKSLSNASESGKSIQESLRKMSSQKISKSGSKGKADLNVKKCSENQLPVLDKRLGSELIWTAQLLLQLRMFDTLDGVLARELYVTATRSIQFLYLRAMSLYLRQCQRDAIPVLDEAIQLDPDNAALWIVKGHCFYEIGQTTEATECYETALGLPVEKENRHLLYLRYGTLALEDGNCDIAKRVFLHGIQKYPTPYMWLATGNTCYMMKDYDQAEAAFAEANRLDNTNPITWAHLALINLVQGQQTLSEQSYKWALRFGLKKGKILEEIKRLQQEKGFGDPSFPRIPNCIPHDYYVRRLGRQKPFDIYRDALINEPPSNGKKRFQDTEREKELKQRLQQMAKDVHNQEEIGEQEKPEGEADPNSEIAEIKVDDSAALEPISIEVPVIPGLVEEQAGDKKTVSSAKTISGKPLPAAESGLKLAPNQGNTEKKSTGVVDTAKTPRRSSRKSADMTESTGNTPNITGRNRSKKHSKKSVK